MNTRIKSLSPVKILLFFLISLASSAQDKVAEAGMKNTVGTTPETAWDAGSTAFPALANNTYWATKHTFRRATDSWNDLSRDIAKVEGTNPILISSTTMMIIRNSYLHRLNKFLPTLSKKNGYNEREIKLLRKIFAPDVSHLITQKLKTDELSMPNPFLAKQIHKFYDDLFLHKKLDTSNLFKRMALGNIRKQGGVPVIGLAPDYARLKLHIIDTKTKKQSITSKC